MKKNLKKILVLVLVLIMSLQPVQVSAKTDFPDQIIYLPVHTGVPLSMGLRWPNENQLKITVADKRIGVIKRKLVDAESGCYAYYFIPKKAGKTLVTMKSKEGTQTQYYRVLKYQNPVSSVKLGKTTVKGSKFDKTDIITLSYSKYAKQNNTIKVVPKKDWYVAYACCAHKRNGVYMELDDSFKPEGGKGNYTMRIVFGNKKNNASTYLDIDFK